MKTLMYPVILAAAAVVAAPALAQQPDSLLSRTSAISVNAPAAGLETIPNPEPRFETRRGVYVSAGGLSRHPAPGRAMVVPDPQTTPEQVAALVTDMNIMSRILTTRAVLPFMSNRRGRVPHIWSTGHQPWLFSSSEDDQARSLYVAGYGLVFFVAVDFPLAAPAQAEAEQNAETPRDDLWVRTRREMYDATGPTHLGAEQPAPSYDPAKVEQFTASLVTTLKHAANIRHIEPTNWVTVTVESPRPDSHRVGATALDNLAALTRVLGGAAPLGGTTLSVRAQKADIDAFAASELDVDEFRQRVEMLTY